MTTFEIVRHPPFEGVTRWGVMQRFPDGSTSTRNFGADLLLALDDFAGLMQGARCVECGDPIWFGWEKKAEAKMREQGVCLTCLNWRELHVKAGPLVAVVNGNRYTIAPDAPRGYGGFVGHGGARFEIQFRDGRHVVTHNLWAQGKVPDHFRDRIPDNAEFVTRGHVRIGAFAGYGGGGSADAAYET